MDLMLPVATWHPNPLLPRMGEERSYEPLLPGESVMGYLDRIGWAHVYDRPSTILVGGVPVKKDQTHLIKPKERVAITVIAQVGETRGSDPARTLFTLASLAASVAIPGALGLSGAKAALASGAIAIGGQLLINQFFPIDQIKETKTDDRVYNIAAANNEIRPFEPVSIICGIYRVFPDMDEKPFTWYEDNEQYLQQTFNFGLGDLFPRRERLGEVALSEFAGLYIDHGIQTVENVDTEPGQTITEATGWVTQTSADDTVEISIDLTGVIVETDEGGKFIQRHVDFVAEYAIAESGNWLPFDPDPVVISHTPPEYESVEYDPENPNPPPGDGWQLFIAERGETDEIIGWVGYEGDSYPGNIDNWETDESGTGPGGNF